MNVTPTELPGLLVIEPESFGDERGFFLETFRKDRYRETGVVSDFVQDNHSRSCRGTLRGLHYQLKRPQGKLVYVTRGEVFDVAVDLRRSSPTFGRWFGTYLNDENHRQMFIPTGFAHGFCVNSEFADFCYKCTDYYDPTDQRSLLWSDPQIGIKWPEIPNLILSPKDQTGMLLATAEAFP